MVQTDLGGGKTFELYFPKMYIFSFEQNFSVDTGEGYFKLELKQTAFNEKKYTEIKFCILMKVRNMKKNKIIVCFLLIFVIFIALIIKINYFFIIITGLLISFFLALDMNNKKLKFDLEIYFFEVITTFYLSREKGMGFNLLEDYYDDIDKLKIILV